MRSIKPRSREAQEMAFYEYSKKGHRSTYLPLWIIVKNTVIICLFLAVSRCNMDLRVIMEQKIEKLSKGRLVRLILRLADAKLITAQEQYSLLVAVNKQEDK